MVLFVFAFQKRFFLNKIFILFFLFKINIFLVFLDHFDALMSKIILKK
jgi:hypothetical protein